MFRSPRRLMVGRCAAVVVGWTLILSPRASSQSPATAPSSGPAPLTIIAKDGRRPLSVTMVGDQEFVGLDDLATAFQLSVREETPGAITVTFKTKMIVLTPDHALASVSGKLISLPAPPAHAGRRWLVPLEFISRALAPIYDVRLELRKPSRLLVVGDLRVPHVTIHFEPLAASARLTLDATPRTAATVSHDNNDRLTVRFDADALDAALPPIQPQVFVQAVRVVDATTIAIDLGPKFAAFRAATLPLDASSRLVIDLTGTPSDVALPPGNLPAPAAAPQQRPSPPPPSPPPPDVLGLTPAATSIRTIAIDAGHGGDDAGAVGAGGTKEKDITLAVARRLRTAFEGRLGIRVLLTRDDDRNVPLDDRTAAANNNKADVFISLHASASPRPAATGASILFATFDQNAGEEAGTSVASGPAINGRLQTVTGGTRDIELVVWDLAQMRHVERSGDLARILEARFRDRVPLSAHPVEQAPLRVLESANMPAVVVEMGYLSNADQEKQLTTNEFQSAVVQAIFDGVIRFRDSLDAAHATAQSGAQPGTSAGGNR